MLNFQTFSNLNFLSVVKHFRKRSNVQCSQRKEKLQKRALLSKRKQTRKRQGGDPFKERNPYSQGRNIDWNLVSFACGVA